LDTETRIPDSRARILSEARSLFLEAGFAETSMQDIAGASGLTKAALYYHFRDKYELFTTMALLELERISQGLEEIFASENALREQLVDAGTYLFAAMEGDFPRMMFEVFHYLCADDDRIQSAKADVCP